MAQPSSRSTRSRQSQVALLYLNLWRTSRTGPLNSAALRAKSYFGCRRWQGPHSATTVPVEVDSIKVFPQTLQQFRAERTIIAARQVSHQYVLAGAPQDVHDVGYKRSIKVSSLTEVPLRWLGHCALRRHADFRRQLGLARQAPFARRGRRRGSRRCHQAPMRWRFHEGRCQFGRGP